MPYAGQEIFPDVFLIPLVRFDRNLNKLGYVYGYCDKALNQLQKSINIGIGYNVQEITNIPTEKHDIKLDYIVIENFCLRNQVL